MKTQIENLIVSLNNEIKELEHKWDVLDSQARIEDQNIIVSKLIALREEVKNLENLIKILEG